MKAFIFFLFLCGCTSTNDPFLERVIIPIENPTQRLSSLVNDIDYITLQDISPHFLGNIDKIIVTENLIIAGDISVKPAVIIYDSTGKFQASIDYIGEGPGEFTHINDFGYDPYEKLIIISMVGKIIYYDLKGNFLKELRSETLYYKFIPINADDILFYLPQVSAQEFIGSGYEEGILFLENPQLKNPKTILSHTFQRGINTPYMLERNVFQIGNLGEVVFSHYFNDTVYVFDRTLKSKRKILVDLGDYKLDNEHFKKYDDEIEALNNLGTKAINQNQLLYDGEYLGGRIMQDGDTYFYLSELKNQKTWVIGNFENDLDGIMPYFQLRGIKDKTLYSVHRIEELPKEVLDKPGSFDFPTNTADNLYFIAKYKLKD